MPALWESSQRPMYVRTVWVDGFRHAILTQDDPYLKKKRRRPNSSASTNKPSSRLSYHEEDKLTLIIKSGKSVITKRPKSSYEPQIEKLHLTDIDQESDEDFVVKASPQTLNESGRYDLYNMRNYRVNKTARTDENTELSDRVLQWLDLAGKVDLLAPNAGRMAQPRHSWPELHRRHLTKSKTVIDIRARISPKTCDSPKAQPNVCIDRHDFYVPTSANTIENYAKQTRNKNTPLHEARETKTKQNARNVAETRQKVAFERTAVQKQYAELVHKKMLPDVSKNSKKQVHIFMPEMPKKPSVSATTSRADSLLSHQALKLLRK